MGKVKTPMLERLSAYSGKSNLIGQFLEWLQDEKGIFLAEDYDGCPDQTHQSTEKLLAEFFEIDLEQVERERRNLLDSIRSEGE